MICSVCGMNKYYSDFLNLQAFQPQRERPIDMGINSVTKCNAFLKDHEN